MSQTTRQKSKRKSSKTAGYLSSKSKSRKKSTKKTTYKSAITNKTFRTMKFIDKHKIHHYDAKTQILSNFNKYSDYRTRICSFSVITYNYNIYICLIVTMSNDYIMGLYESNNKFQIDIFNKESEHEVYNYKFKTQIDDFKNKLDTNKSTITKLIETFMLNINNYKFDKIEYSKDNKEYAIEDLGNFDKSNYTNIKNVISFKKSYIKNIIKQFYDKCITKPILKQYSIVIIGSGPTALILAISLLDKYSNITVTMYEKRVEYNRRQFILVENNMRSYQLGPSKFAIDMDDKCHISFPNKDYKGRCVEKHKIRSRFIYTQIYKLENHLKEKAVKLGAIIKTKHINTLDDINCPYDIIFGADGPNSNVRKNILNAKDISDKRYISYGMILNYKEYKKKTYIPKNVLNVFNRDAPLQNRVRFFRNKHGDAYIGLQLTSSEYNNCGKYNKYNRLPTKCKQLFQYYMDLYKSKPLNNLENEPIGSFKIEHKIYDKYADIINGKLVFLIGDSVSQSHFFTASGLTRGYNMITGVISILDRFMYLPESDSKLSTYYKNGINDYNIYISAQINEYYNSFINGYMSYNLSKHICPKLTDNDWNNIKYKLEKLKDNGKEIDKDFKKNTFNLPNNKDEMCKLFSEYIIEHYKHLAS